MLKSQSKRPRGTPKKQLAPTEPVLVRGAYKCARGSKIAQIEVGEKLFVYQFVYWTGNE